MLQIDVGLKWLVAGAILCAITAGCTDSSGPAPNESFTIVMIPDTQNSVNFRHQIAEGFVIESSDIFIGQMEYIAGRAVGNGGDVVFVASVGDVWEHATQIRDAAHEDRGINSVSWSEPSESAVIDPAGVLEVELPTAVAGYRIISESGIPFGVAPGNHDYDAWFPTPDPNGNGNQTHIGGLSNFVSVFGSDSEFYRDKHWYVDSYNDGANSAQIFTGGGYRFLHLALEMHPGDDVLLWAAEVIDRYFGVPTIISTHDYLNADGERMPAWGMDLAYVDPSAHNSAEELWRSFISKVDQVFMVLSGHQSGQALRIDTNDYGNEVYQILADFQYRAQAGWDAGMEADGPPPGIGDGWLRELIFNMEGQVPHVDVRTYSSHYSKYSSGLETYAAWYRDIEQPEMTDEQFLAADEFTLVLSDFRQRFGPNAPR